MLKEREAVIRKFMFVVDLSVVAAAYLVAFVMQPLFSANTMSLQRHFVFLLLAAPLWGLTLYANGMFLSMRTRSYVEIVWAILKSAAISFWLLGTIVFLFQITYISRLFYILFAGMSFVFILIEKTILFVGAHYVRRQNLNTRRLLIVGTGPRAADFVRRVDRHPEWGFELLGAINDEPVREISQVDRLKIVGAIEDMPRIFHDDAVDEVVFVVPRSRLSSLVGAIDSCETEGIVVTVCVDLFDTRLAKASVSDLDGLPLLRFKTTHTTEWQLFLKQMFDFTFSLLAIIVFSPLLLIVAILIKVTSPGPIFFKQSRLGYHGRRFTLYKFRTMRKGAHDVLSIVSDLNDMTTPEFRLKKTQWITPVGRVLRKLSLDELPQLFNVFAGTMSFVGPRPTVPDEVDKYQTWQRRRFSMKPGITCLWQIKGRNNIAFEDWMKLDLEYLDNWSLRLDFIILLKTIPVVIFGKGAY
jgi:exopolysaccharide biosynthesis polyprenyl glycosylphosphotransferase